MNHVFIINPISGNGKYAKVIAWVEAYFKDSLETYQIHITQYPGHAKTIAATYGAGDVLYAVGGDGTAHEVLNGMNFTSELAIIPAGTGNDFFRMLSKQTKLETILLQTVEGVSQCIDVGTVNSKYFLNCLNLGLDAQVNFRVNEARNGHVPRSLLYMFYALAEVFKKKVHPIRVTQGDMTFETSVLLASFMNGKWYGGGFKSAPLAKLDDGLLEMILVSDMSILKILNVLPRYFRGKHLALDVVTYRRVNKVVISSNTEIVCGVDGEVFKDFEVTIDVLAHALTLRRPAEQI